MVGKRGLSTKHGLMLIGAIILIIIIVLLITLKGTGGGKKNSSLLKRVELDLDIKSVKVQEDLSVNVNVKRKEGQGNIVGVRFIFEDEYGSEIVDLNYLISEGEEKEFSIFLSEVDPNYLSTVTISPIIEMDDGVLTPGAVKDEYKIKRRRTYDNDYNYQYPEDVEDPFDPFNSEEDSCNENCSNLGFECGSQTVCDLETDCGNCSDFGDGFVCSGSSCVAEETCEDNCSVFNFECGDWTVCGELTDCGTCGIGFTCNATGLCEEEYVCEDNCSILNYECGDWTICEELTDCGDCTSYGPTFVCNATGLCIDGYTCEDTCETYNYECGNFDICGDPTDCGDCLSYGANYLCNISGLCEEICTDTCSSLGLECGTHMICGESTACGSTCTDGKVCTSDSCNAGTCEYNVLCGADGTCCASEGCTSDPDCPEYWETGIVSWWDFDSNANDKVGSNDGTTNGGVSLVSTDCKSGSCYNFDGSSGYIDVGTFSVSGSQITISAWANYDGSTFDLDPRIISKASGTATSDHVFLLGLDDFSSGTYAEYRFRFEAGGSVLSHNDGTVNPPTGWKHIVGVYDGSTSEIYVNGVSQGTLSKTGPLTVNSDAVNIGRNPVYGESSWRYWNGKLDEIIIWNRALNSTEVNDIYSYF
jgi:concanavalin A-like lectin/glucanase superfamily protein